ncbi:hypothetical protein NEDG_01627 [Nematocida displodere]|uniref:Uncharacterized protein n=1 Tax=Nematocida displodere TaxID=1805483 RepID=A0A177EGW8_9MICR|nr:hypothetical protein NEDG_01627 [Nematocida displodere]
MLTSFFQELDYFQRALRLRPLQRTRSKKVYTRRGVLSNVLSLAVLMVLSASVFKTLGVAQVTSFKTISKVATVYIGIGAAFFPFWMSVAIGALGYRKLFMFENLESWYMVLYSVSSSFPLIFLNKFICTQTLPLLVKTPICLLIGALSACMSIYFIYTNSAISFNNGPKRTRRLGTTTFIQFLIIGCSSVVYEPVGTIASFKIK